MDQPQEPRSPYALRITPLAPGRALALFAVVYICSAILWPRCDAQARAALVRNWPILVIFLLPLALVIFRMLFSLLKAPWFAVVVIACLAATSILATFLYTPEAALARVYRTFPFAALGATLAACLLACIISRPISRRNIPYLLLHAGLLVVIIGGFLSLFLRVNGHISLIPGRSADSIQLRDYALTLTAEDGRKEVVPLPLEGLDPIRGHTHEARLGDLHITTLYEAPDSPWSRGLLTVFAEDAAAAATAKVSFGGMPSVLNLGGHKYMLTFAPTRLPLPFEVALVDSNVEFHPATAIPKEYTANITISAEGRPKRSVTLRVNHPASEAGFDILLNDVDPDGRVVLEIARDPGANILFAGGVLAIGAFMMSLMRRMRERAAAGDADES